MEWRKLDFETQGVRHEGKRKLLRQIRNTDTTAGSYDLEFLCSKMQIKRNRAIYDMELRELDFESLDVRHEGKGKLVPQMRSTHTTTCD